jgi:transcriptional regulator with XRE-family HTH domain
MGERDLSLREVARRVPCSAGFLSNIAHGRKGASEQIASRLDDVLNASGELAALAETETRVREEKRAIPHSHAPGQPSAGAEGLSLSLPYVPGRLVIEVSAPVVNAVRAAPETGYPEQASGQLALVQNMPYSGQRDGR